VSYLLPVVGIYIGQCSGMREDGSGSPVNLNPLIEISCVVVLIHPIVTCSYQQASKQSPLGLSFNETTN
jgi:hypothetical protein